MPRLDHSHAVELGGDAPGDGLRHQLPIGRAILVAIVCGLVLGGLNSLSNVLGSPYSPRSLAPLEGILPLQVLAAILGTPGAWALVAFIVGWLSRGVWSAVVSGVIALLVADLTYYLSDSLSGYAALSRDEVLYWAALAVPTGLVMGLLGGLGAQPRWWSIAPALCGPAACVVLARPSASDQIQPWQELATLAAAALTAALVLVVWLLRLRGSRSNSG